MKSIRRCVKRLVPGVILAGGLTTSAWATWTPLIVADDFLGIKTDMGVAVTGLLSIILIVVGLGILVNILSHR